VLSEDLEPFCREQVTEDFLLYLVRKVPRTLSVSVDDQIPPTTYLRATHGRSCAFDPLDVFFCPYFEQEMRHCEFAVAAVSRSSINSVTMDGLAGAPVGTDAPRGVYLSPFLPHRFEEHAVIGFEIRDGDVAVVIDMQVALSCMPPKSCWVIAAQPNVMGYLERGNLMWTAAPIPPCCILEICTFQVPTKRLYLNASHLYLFPYANNE
jgi:hypothetical protein